jgi:hypothetical protein
MQMLDCYVQRNLFRAGIVSTCGLASTLQGKLTFNNQCEQRLYKVSSFTEMLNEQRGEFALWNQPTTQVFYYRHHRFHRKIDLSIDSVHDMVSTLDGRLLLLYSDVAGGTYMVDTESHHQTDVQLYGFNRIHITNDNNILVTGLNGFQLFRSDEDYSYFAIDHRLGRHENFCVTPDNELLSSGGLLFDLNNGQVKRQLPFRRNDSLIDVDLAGNIVLDDTYRGQLQLLSGYDSRLLRSFGHSLGRRPYKLQITTSGSVAVGQDFNRIGIWT